MSCLPQPTVRPGSPCKARGQIQVILGPMFSGKSTELMRRVQRFQIAQHKCLVIKYAKDTRYSSMFSTRDWSTTEALPTCQLWDAAREALGADVIGIDEGQFFPDIVEFSETMANSGKTVIVAALDGTFQRKAFGAILNLVPLAESVVKLNAVCMGCSREAAYTKRLGLEQEVEVIGGADKYHAVCRLCYFQKASDPAVYPGRLSLGRPAPPSGCLSPAAPSPHPPDRLFKGGSPAPLPPPTGALTGCETSRVCSPSRRPISLLACPLAFLGSLPGCWSTHDPLRAGAGPVLWLGFWPWQTPLLLLWGEGPATCCCDIGAGFLPLVASTAEFLFSLASPSISSSSSAPSPLHTEAPVPLPRVAPALEDGWTRVFLLPSGMKVLRALVTTSFAGRSGPAGAPDPGVCRSV